MSERERGREGGGARRKRGETDRNSESTERDVRRRRSARRIS